MLLLPFFIIFNAIFKPIVLFRGGIIKLVLILLIINLKRRITSSTSFALFYFMAGNNFKDLTGQTFGLLNVIGINVYVIKRVEWECVCECGMRCKVTTNKLKSGRKKSCGCLKRKGHRFINLIGMKFNLLTVTSLHSRGNKIVIWNCLCDCGNTHLVRASNLKNGAVKSCGCLGKHSNRRHGLSNTALATTLVNMKGRCYRKSTKCYPNYGGRGIKICDEWLSDSNNFFQWAFANGYKEGLTIERVDCDKNYCPENCTWIPQYEQARNRRVSIGVEKVKEIKVLLSTGHTAISIAKIYNVHPTTIGYIKRGKAYPYVTI